MVAAAAAATATLDSTRDSTVVNQMTAADTSIPILFRRPFADELRKIQWIYVIYYWYYFSIVDNACVSVKKRRDIYIH